MRYTTSIREMRACSWLGIPWPLWWWPSRRGWGGSEECDIRGIPKRCPWKRWPSCPLASDEPVGLPLPRFLTLTFDGDSYAWRLCKSVKEKKTKCRLGLHRSLSAVTVLPTLSIWFERCLQKNWNVSICLFCCNHLSAFS